MQGELRDDPKLLELMLDDSRNQSPVYCPGPYWMKKARTSANGIKRWGITDFRGSSSLVGLSYADNLYLDDRSSYSHGLRRLAKKLTMVFPLNRIYDSQAEWIRLYANEAMGYTQELLGNSQRVKDLLAKYKMPYSLLGKCMRKVEIDGSQHSVHYINLLEQHDNIASRISFKDLRSIFEIGGGFGANVHLLLENYKNIRKVLYLDIAPNLYVGTQYLKAFYKDAVLDYRALRDRDSIRFSGNDDLEIFCIAPWQIEKFESSAEALINMHSFVEMPKDIIKNYVGQFNRFPGSGHSAIALTTYESHDPGTTLDPAQLPKLFEKREFDVFEASTILDSSRRNFFFVSPGKYSTRCK
jgi:putative sugar O-methyltransferase